MARPQLTLVALLSVPLLGLAVLLAAPDADVHWQHQPSHFWLVLLTAQVLLIRSRKLRLHKKLGLAAVGLAPLMVVIGREALPAGGSADETLLIEAEALAAEAMRID